MPGLVPHRPAWLTGIDDLALAYLHHLQDRGLRDVLVVGSSIGGWTAAEMAVRDAGGIITGLVLVDPAGVHVEAEPIRDFRARRPRRGRVRLARLGPLLP
ncbi:alpha/beta fold hydrolase [Streptomyces sp. NPDC057686]|uniref:alpha/beta fold hydrolase n=1 Tax=Streptomyces sp. NPDC057686 TaxID=3346212 RepID=UPI0036839FB6